MSADDYVFFSSKTQAFECHHCGGQHAPTLPMPIDQFVSMGKGFVLMHKHCPKPVEPSRQIELPVRCVKCGEQVVARDAIEHFAACQGKAAGIDGASDQPDPETDPPEANPYRMFELNYPKATDQGSLFDALHAALGPVIYANLDGDTVRGWHPDSGVFEAVANWARCENARKVHSKRPPTAGMVVPVTPTMPAALAQALVVPKPKARPRKKPTTRKAQ